MATGSGTGTPITSSPSGSAIDVQPPTWTHLSLFRYAKILGLSPLHFAGASTPSLDPIVFPADGCDSFWPRYSWQDSDQVSWQDLAQQIASAEHDIAQFLGYPVGPEWVVEEVHPWPRHFRRENFGTGLDHRMKSLSIKASNGMVSAVGQRAVSLVGTATVVGGSLTYQDLDGDGFAEVARIQLSTSLTDARECKVYFYNQSANPDWEVRTILSRSISGGVLTIVVPSWELIDPELQAVYPTSDGQSIIDASTTAVNVTSVDVYREYLDTTTYAAQFLWSPMLTPTFGSGLLGGLPGSTGETVGALTTQTGTATVIDPRLGFVAPVPSTYSESTGWTLTDWTVRRDPDQVKLWYRAGLFSQNYLRGYTEDPLSDSLARAIAYMATARLSRSLCSCGNAKGLADSLQEDFAVSDRNRSRYISFEQMNNPFGTRRGEVLAWQEVSKMTNSVVSGRTL